MTTKTQTILSGITAKVGAFLTAWTMYGSDWGHQALGLFTKEQAPYVIAVTTSLTLIAGIYKTLLDAKGNSRAKAVVELVKPE